MSYCDQSSYSYSPCLTVISLVILLQSMPIMISLVILLQSMSYRDQPRPKSPQRFQPQVNNSLLDDFDHRPDSPPEAAGSYDDDRIHNDLLEEICSDIGIRDTMDLDFLDFDGSEAFTKLPDEGD